MMNSIVRLLSRSSVSEVVQVDISSSLHSPCLLLELPDELLLLIDSFLAYENALALSLTCRKFYNLLFMLHKPTPRHNGREIHFLRLLEREFPDKIACAIHERLYDWRKQKAKQYPCPSCDRGRANGYTVICNKSCKKDGIGIFEAERRLILRGALLGRQYGLPMSSVQHRCKRDKHGTANTVIPKIVNGSLMLARSHHFHIQILSRGWHESNSVHLREAICVHSDDHIKALLALAVEHAQRKRATAKLENTKCQTRWIYPDLIKCKSCATDIRLRMELIGQTSVAVRLDVYQDLGGLQDVSVSQRQVMSLLYDWRSRYLSPQEAAVRYGENLELRFHDPDVEKIHAFRFCCTYNGEYQLEFLQDWLAVYCPDGVVSYRHLDPDKDFIPDAKQQVRRQ